MATGKLENIGQLSGRALKVLLGPLIDKTEKKRLLYGGMLREIVQHVLFMQFGVEHKVKLVWPELIPSDPAEEAATLLLHEQIGVSRATLLAKLGYSPEAEAEQKGKEQEAAVEAMQTQFDRGQMPGGNNPYGGKQGGEGQ